MPVDTIQNITRTLDVKPSLEAALTVVNRAEKVLKARHRRQRRNRNSDGVALDFVSESNEPSEESEPRAFGNLRNDSIDLARNRLELSHHRTPGNRTTGAGTGRYRTRLGVPHRTASDETELLRRFKQNSHNSYQRPSEQYVRTEFGSTNGSRESSFTGAPSG